MFVAFYFGYSQATNKILDMMPLTLVRGSRTTRTLMIVPIITSRAI